MRLGDLRLTSAEKWDDDLKSLIEQVILDCLDLVFIVRRRHQVNSRRPGIGLAVGNNIDLASFLGEVVDDQSLENLKRALDKIGLFVGGRVNAEAFDELRLSILPCLQSAWQPDQPLEVALGRLCRSEVNLRLNDRLRTGLGDEPVVAAQKMDGDVGLSEVFAHSVIHL